MRYLITGISKITDDFSVFKIVQSVPILIGESGTIPIFNTDLKDMLVFNNLMQDSETITDDLLTRVESLLSKGHYMYIEGISIAR